MKTFFCVIPKQGRGSLASIRYEPEGNPRLDLGRETRFPILCVINGYVEPGEEFRVITVNFRDEDTADRDERKNQNETFDQNAAFFREELDTLCKEKGLLCRELTPVYVGTDQKVSTQTGLFLDLIKLGRPDDELFACLTYGAKTTPIVVKMAVQYLYRAMKDSSIGCVVYGNTVFSGPGVVQEAKVCDVTALLRLEEITRMVAEREVSDPTAVIESIMKL